MWRSLAARLSGGHQVRARIQSVVAEVAARYDVDELRYCKAIIDDVRSETIPFFAQCGISIATIGIFGG